LWLGRLGEGLHELGMVPVPCIAAAASAPEAVAQEDKDEGTTDENPQARAEGGPMQVDEGKPV